jgi:hypothetical protein
MDDLRIQTQKRIEGDVIGWGIIDEARNTKGKKGVGNIEKFGSDHKTEQANSITSYKSDFNSNLLDADFSLDNLNILVCKKNVGILKNLLIWLDDCLLDGKTAFDIPLLIVDDEADNASLNNLGEKGRENATKTNGHIRAILALFTRRTYLGYTATPFANVLQDRNEVPEEKWVIEDNRNGGTKNRGFPQVDNLFPDDFIVLLNPPTNYVGAKSIFETVKPIDNEIGEKLPVVVAVNDFVEHFPSRIDQTTGEGVEAVTNKNEFENSLLFSKYSSYAEYCQLTRASRRDDEFPQRIPQSLKDAIACFIITIAVRELRGPKMMHSKAFCPHHTMLIHISRFIPWQNSTKRFVKDEVSEICARLMNESPTAPGSIYKNFEIIWYKYYAEIVTNIQKYLPSGYVDPYLLQVTFGSIREGLVSAANNISTRALNSAPENSGDTIQYDDKNPQKVIAIGGNRLSRGFTLEGLTVNYFVRTAGCADTLLQMGRWFGYRPGYLDCCKIFTTSELIDRFDLTTRTIEELEGEFRKMEAVSKSPSDFELRVRKHPGTLKITRPSILKNTTEVKWSYQDQLVQETKFSVKGNDITRAWQAFCHNVAHPHTYKQEKGFWVTAVDGQTAANLIDSIGNLDEITKSSLKKFIQLANSGGNKLSEWKIAIRNTGGGSPLPSSVSGLPFSIDSLTIRRGPKETPSRFRDDFTSRRLFHATGKSQNIVSSAKDLALFLSADQIAEAENSFIQERKNYYLLKNPEWSPERALKEAQSLTIPERVYRERMSDQNALILIYLLDAKHVFCRDEGDSELAEIAQKEGIDWNIPLVGYAVGFPPIHPDPGVTYLKGDYDLADEDTDELDEDAPALHDNLT